MKELSFSVFRSIITEYGCRLFTFEVVIVGSLQWTTYTSAAIKAKELTLFHSLHTASLTPPPSLPSFSSLHPPYPSPLFHPLTSFPSLVSSPFPLIPPPPSIPSLFSIPSSPIHPSSSSPPHPSPGILLPGMQIPF